MLNPVWLKTFKTLIEVGHFTKTADKLHMTQPGVSQHIQKLEQACKHSLIRRDKKSFEMTEQGRLVYEYANSLDSNEALLMESLSFDDPYSGLCRLSCSGSLALSIYPQLLALQTAHSGLNISLEAAPNYKILEDIKTGAVDQGIVTYIPSPCVFDSEVLAEESLCLILPVAYKNQVITSSTLKECGLIAHPDADAYFSLYLDNCANDELDRLMIEDIPQTGYINQLSQILLPVAQGLGFTVLPRSAVDAFGRKDDLVIHQPAKQVMETLYLVQKRNKLLPKRYLTLKQAVLESLGTKGKPNQPVSGPVSVFR
ncbi:LysR family transcriptional regulator [Litoribacillus peritrichatus]|uniref:LysR family transcriptional regulator n=1 Tax=Litoribacillus peritrichatus TaxID=718191 RepID=A0ABP7MZY5_9GAMM